MTTLYLLFAHMVADFVLQPHELVKWKHKSFKGSAFHALVHFFVTLLIFYPFFPSWKLMWVIVAICGAHFLIDIIKVFKERRGSNFLIYFIADQLAHLAVILTGGWFLADLAPRLESGSLAARMYENIYIVIGLSLLIFVTYTMEIIVFQVRRWRDGDKGGMSKVFKPQYDKMVRRAILFTALYAAFMIFGVYSVAAWN